MCFPIPPPSFIIMRKEFKIFFINSQLIDKFKDKTKKLLWFLGKSAFMFILLFILLDLIFAGFIFYKYIFLINIEESTVLDPSTKFNENMYQSVLKEIEIRENIYKNLSQ